MSVQLRSFHLSRGSTVWYNESKNIQKVIDLIQYIVRLGDVKYLVFNDDFDNFIRKKSPKEQLKDIIRNFAINADLLEWEPPREAFYNLEEMVTWYQIRYDHLRSDSEPRRE